MSKGIENTIAPEDVYLGKAFLHRKSMRLFIETDNPDEEHNCDAMGCSSVGGHIIWWSKEIVPDDKLSIVNGQ